MKRVISILTALGYLSLITPAGLKSQNTCNFIITGQVNSSGGNPLPGISVNYTGVPVSGGTSLTGTGYTNFYGQFYLNIPVVSSGTAGGVYIFYLNMQGCDTGIAVPAFTLTPNNCGVAYWIGTVTLPACEAGPCTTTMTLNPSGPQAGQPVIITASGAGGQTPLSTVLFENAAPIVSASGGVVTWVPASGNVYYDVCVAAHYPGCVNVVCQTVPVYSGNPACFGHYFEPIYNVNGNVLSYSAYYWGSVSAGNATFFWDFGDGNTSTQPNGTHTYAWGGTYTVCGSVSWANGCVLDTCFTITVSGPTPSCQATIWYAVDSAANNPFAYYLGVSPLNTSSQITAVIWLPFNLTGNPVQYTFSGPGNYPVCAIVSFANGCTYTVCDTIVVNYPTPCTNFQIIANAVPSTNSGVVTYWVSLLSPSVPANVMWILPNGNTAYGYQGTFSFPSGGSVTLCAVATWPNGCVDTSCITLNLIPNTNGSICGCVQLPYSGAIIPADLGTAYLVQYNPFNNTLNALATTGISNGQFCFQNVQPGAYLVKAALAPASPHYWNYVPTYYSNVPFWWQATQVVVSPNALNVNIGCITMIPGINPGGPGFIGGSIFQGANKSAPGDPVPNVAVLLLNMDDSPVAYTYTDHLGQYSFPNLPYGTYKVWPEQAGIPTTPAIVTIGPDNPSQTDVNIALMSTGFVSVQALGEQALDVNIGPNPASERLFIRFNQDVAYGVEMLLTDLQGRVLLSQWWNPALETEASLDLSRIPSGLYQLTLKGQSKVSTFKIVRR
jgi:hypothetical protein